MRTATEQIEILELVIEFARGEVAAPGYSWP